MLEIGTLVPYNEKKRGRNNIASEGIYDFMYRMRWPNGFECPQCGTKACSEVSTRKMPLYQCSGCRRQTSLTSNTVMAGSRTSASQWAAAIQLLAASGGVNAERLSVGIGVSYKTAWGMLRSIRQAMSAAEAERPLRGEVCAGAVSTGRWFYQPFRLYPDERVIIVGASVDPETGMPFVLKLYSVPRHHLTDYKEITPRGKAEFEERYVHPEAKRYTYFRSVEMHRFNPLVECFDEARSWLNVRFGALSAASIQPYLDEYCFRFNVAARGGSMTEELLWLCLRPNFQRSGSV